MFPNPKRLVRRVLILGVMAVLMIPAFSSMASAAIPQVQGSAKVVGSVVPRKPVSLSTDYGYMSSTGTYLFNTEVHDPGGAKVAQWTETLSVTKGQHIVRSYTWYTNNTWDGKYSISIGISKQNWTGLIAWTDSAGSVNLVSTPWTTSAIPTQSSSSISIDGRFASPSNAYGSYVEDMTVYDGSGKLIQEWKQNTTINGAKTSDFVKSLNATGLAPGSYTVKVKLMDYWSKSTIASNSNAGTFTVAAPAPPVTTTTVPPTTSTTVPPTTVPAPTPTTVPDTTPTTVPDTTSTTVPDTTTTVPPVTTTVPPVTTTTVPPTTTTTVPPTTTTTVPPSYNSNWKVIVDDEFNASSLNQNLWATYDGTGNEGVGYRSSANIVEGNGEVKLIGNVSKLTGAGMCLCNGQAPLTTYGRYEIRAKMDKGNGFGPALMLWPNSNVWPGDGEIDISEIPQGARTQSFFTDHYGSANNQISAQSNGDFSQWHTYGLEWEPDHLTYFLDGVAVKTITTPGAVPSKGMHLTIQNDAGAAGHWIAAPDSNSPAQINLHIDWIKVYAP